MHNASIQIQDIGLPAHILLPGTVLRNPERFWVIFSSPPALKGSLAPGIEDPYNKDSAI